MNLYATLDATYHRLARRSRPPTWCGELGFASLDALVATVRNDQPDPQHSDLTLRRLLTVGRREPDAVTVALYALAPALRARTGRAVTEEYRGDALTALAFVVLDSPLDASGLAHRLVNRAHTRVHKAAGRVNRGGCLHPVTITPQDPQVLTQWRGVSPDFADTVTRRVDLGRFHTAVEQAIADGELSETLWVAYRDHRLRRVVDPTTPPSNGTQRKLAGRAVPKLQPIIDTHLHAA